MIRYLNEVLGVKQILLPIVSASSDEGIELSDKMHLPNHSLKVLFVCTGEYSADVQDLFYKMITAMKLEQTQIQLINYRQKSLIDFEIEILSSQAVVFFTDEASDWQELAQSKSVFCVQTFGPEYLLRNPQFKKQTWEQLQAVMAAIEPYRS